MPVSPNPITGWAEAPITSVHYAHDLATYEIVATSGSASALNTAHAFYSLSKDIKRWVWEIEIIGTTDIASRTIAGVSLAKTNTTLPFSLFSVPPGTVYESNGTVVNTNLVFEPYGDGDLLTFVIDYEDRVLLAYLNGVFQGAMLTPENFPLFTSPFFPLFATSESGIGCRIQDGAPTSISKDTLTFNLRDPIDPMAPADDSLSPPIKVNFQTVEQYGIDIVDMQAAAVDEGFITTVDALAYYSNNPNIMQIAGLTQQESYPPLSTQFDMQIPPYRLDIVASSERFYWDEETAIEGTRISNENVTASNEIVGIVRTNSFKNSGNVYWECKIIEGGPNVSIGLGLNNADVNNFVGYDEDSWGIFRSHLAHDGTITDHFSPLLGNGDTVNIAMDIDKNLLWFGVNGVWLDGGNPTLNLNPTFTNVIGPIYPMISSIVNSYWIVDGYFSNFNIEYPVPNGYVTIDNTFEPVVFPRPIIKWETPAAGLSVSPDGLTASGAGSVIADHIVNEDDTKQFYMEFTIDDDTDLMGIGVEAYDPSLLKAHQYWRIATSEAIEDIDITEIEMIDVTSSPDPLDTATAIIISGGEWNNDFAAEYAFNGTYTVIDEFETGVRWRSDSVGVNIRWIGLDFGIGDERRVTKMNVKGGFSFTTNWDIQYSDDGVLWTTIKSGINIPTSTTEAIDTNIDNTIETMLYQSNGALGTLDTRPNVALDPSNSSATWQFFKDDTQAADVGFYGTSKATLPAPTGKSYWEIKIESPSDMAAVIVGMAPLFYSNDDFPGQTEGFGWNGGTGNIWVEGAEFPFTAPYTVGDIINIAIDTITGSVWLGLNGVWTAGDPELGTGAIITGLVGDYWAAVGDATNTLTETVAYTSNFGQFVFANTQPIGFGTYGPIAGAGNFASYATGDVIGLSIDSDTGDMWWSVNGTSIAGDFVVGSEKPAYSFEHLKIKFTAVNAEMTANYGSELFDQTQFRTFESFGCGDGGFAGSSPCLSSEDIDQITTGFLIVNINDVGDRFFGAPEISASDFAFDHIINPTYENSLINSFNVIEEFTLFGIGPGIEIFIVGPDPIFIDISTGINGGEMPPFAIQVPLVVAIAGFGIPLPPENDVANIGEELVEYISPFIVKIPFDDIFNPTQIILSTTSIETDHIVETVHTPFGWPQPTEFAIPEVSGNFFNDTRPFVNFSYLGATNPNIPNVHLMVNQITTMPFDNTEVIFNEPISVTTDVIDVVPPFGTITVSETPEVQRIVYLEPTYPDKTSGRIGGGGA